MKVKILKVENGKLVEAEIKESGNLQLPSVQEGWRFNFPKHSKSKGAHTYVLSAEETRRIIEGCLIYKMKDNHEPYMAYIEIAPHNRGNDNKYERVAGCLIAFACRLSFILGQADFKGWLAFDVLEEKEEDQKKLMALYSKNYKAKRFGETTMYITPQDGEELIKKYL